LIELGSAVVPQLVKALKGDEPSVRYNAAVALGKIGDKGAVIPLINAFAYHFTASESYWNESNDYGIYNAIIEALADLGDDRAIPQLIEGLKYEDSGQFGPATLALFRFGERAVLPLTEALNNEVIQLRYNTTYLLSQLGVRRAVQALTTALTDVDSRVRAGAAFALGFFNDSQAVEPLLSALEDADSDVRFWSAVSLVKLHYGPAVEYLVDVLRNDASVLQRASAAYSLGEFGDIRAVEPLIMSLKEEKDDAIWGANVRWHAAEALGKLADERALPILKWVREHDQGETTWDARVRDAASEAISRIESRLKEEAQ
jgi:HEAT repeat protein